MTPFSKMTFKSFIFLKRLKRCSFWFFCWNDALGFAAEIMIATSVWSVWITLKHKILIFLIIEMNEDFFSVFENHQKKSEKEIYFLKFDFRKDSEVGYLWIRLNSCCPFIYSINNFDSKTLWKFQIFLIYQTN